MLGMNITVDQGDAPQAATTPVAEQLSRVPFQVQVEFTAPDGARYLRVVSDLRERTQRRETAEAGEFHIFISH